MLSVQEVLKNLEGHRQTFQQIHRDRSVNGVPVPPEQLQDMAERSTLMTLGFTVYRQHETAFAVHLMSIM